MNRGCIPLRILNHYDKNASESNIHFSEIEHVPNAGWLPRRRVRIIQNGAVVDRLVVTQIDTVNKPPASVFQLEFPEPIDLVDRTNNLVSKGRKIWSLLSLPKANSPGTKAFLTAPAPPAEMPGEIDSTPPWGIILFGIAFISLVAGSIVVFRRRRRGSQGV